MTVSQAPASSAAIPAPPRLPPVTSTAFWTQDQWAVFWALLEAVSPSIRPEPDVTDEQHQIKIPRDQYSSALRRARATLPDPLSDDGFAAYLDYCPAQDPVFRNNLERTVSWFPEEAKNRLGGVLSALTTRPGSLFLAGYWSPIHLQPVHVREAVLKSWRASRIGTLRTIAGAFVALAAKAIAQTSPGFHQLTGYPETAEDERGPDQPPAQDFDFEFLQFCPLPPSSAPDAATATATSSSSSSSPEAATPSVIETDIIIVGSGCGGAVAAKRLAEAGHAVLVVDKAYHHPASHFPMAQDVGSAHLYEGGGFLSSRDSSLALVAGSCWGGGGTINWSVSLQTQGFVRREWAVDRGLPFFESARFQEHLDHVCSVMGVVGEGAGAVGGASASAVCHNHRNRVLLEGSRKLGWQAGSVPQNTGNNGEEHYCGRCTLGCRSGGKKGPVVSWLPAAGRAGARFIEGFEVERVTFDDDDNNHHPQGAQGGEKEGGQGRSARRATGVVGRWTSRGPDGSVSGSPDDRVTREVVVKAKKVIVSAGTLWSPVLLMRSGLTNRHIGQNLHVHPCHLVVAMWDDSVKPWEGSVITSCCSTFENLDNAGHGVKLEPTSMVPYAVINAIPWRSGLDSKLQALKYPRMNAFISMARDRDTGNIAPDPVSGRPRITYSASALDRSHALEGVVALAKICYVQGAREIVACLPGIEPFVVRDDEDNNNDNNNNSSSNVGGPAGAGEGGDDKENDKTDAEATGTTAAAAANPSINDPRFAAWLARVREVGNAGPGVSLASAHQMGTCRMAANEDEGVVDSEGRVFGVEGLYVADASVFPSASGVNPMITNMAIADWIASCVDKEIGEGRV